jgi:hypothetical protein
MKLYAVGTYIDKSDIPSMDNNDSHTCKKEKIQSVLCNPISLSRTIRIIIHWKIPNYLLIKGIANALRPRLIDKISNQEIDELLNDLKLLMESDEDIEVGTVVNMVVKGDTMYYSRGKNDGSRITLISEDKKIQHKEFCFALCDNYYGDTAVSIDHKESVIEGIISLTE